MRYNSTITKIPRQIWKWIVWGFFSLQKIVTAWASI